MALNWYLFDLVVHDMKDTFQCCVKQMLCKDTIFNDWFHTNFHDLTREINPIHDSLKLLKTAFQIFSDCPWNKKCESLLNQAEHRF